MRGLILLSALLLSLPPAQADEGGAKAELQAAYDQLYSAVMRKEFRSALGLLAPDYSLAKLDGTPLKRAQLEGSWKGLTEKFKSAGTARVEIEKLSTDGKTARANVHIILFYSVSGPTDKSETQERFSDDRLQDTWLKTRSGWRLQRSEEMRANIGGVLRSEKGIAESPRLAALERQLKERDAGALDALWHEARGKGPLVEPVPGDDNHAYVTFLWRGDRGTRKVLLIGGLPDVGEKPLSRLADTELWYRTEKITKKARFVYSFLVTGVQVQPAKVPAEAKAYTTFTADPLNSHPFAFGSKLELPDAPTQPYIERRAGVPQGKLERLKIHSDNLKQERTCGLYLPPGYDSKARPYGLLVVLDGQNYGNGPTITVPAPTILDNLLAAGKIRPMVAVLVNNLDEQSRDRDLKCSVPFADFLAKELVPRVRSHYRVSADPNCTVICGSSFGGLCAAFCGLRHSDIFGCVLSQSGSFYYTPDEAATPEPYLTQSGWMMDQYAQARKLPLRFYLQVGLLESGAGMVATNRHLRDVLRLKGYPVTYSEMNGGHDALAWRGSLADGLSALVGTRGRD
jgi:enterochelin esterase family protein